MANVLVTNYSSNEPYVSVHVANPSKILVVNNTVIPAPMGYNISSDGGRTFLSFSLVLPPPFNAAVDPTSDSYTPNIFLIGGLVGVFKCGVSQNVSSVCVWKSVDFGMNFVPKISASAGRTFQYDKPVLTIDKLSTRFKGTAYIAVQAINLNGTNSRISFQFSSNTGDTWSTPVDISPILSEGAAVVTDRNGVVYVSWLTRVTVTTANFIVRRSLDGGRTFQNQVQVVSLNLIPNEKLPVPTWDFRVPTFSFLAADVTTGLSTSGRIYAVWQSFNNGVSQIFLSFSLDSGNTWQAPVRVDNSPANAQNFFPAITVAPDTGTVSIIFYSNRQDPARAKLDVFLAQSINGGRTFINTRVTDVSFDPNNGALGGRRTFIGDYISVASLGGAINYSVWTDTRNGFSQIFGNRG